MLSDEEKENILIVLADRDSERAIELAEPLNNTGKRKKSILLLRRLISGNAHRFSDERICFIYLDQLKTEKLDLREAAMKCLKQCPNESMLGKIVDMIASEGAAFEQILERENAGELLNYLQKTGRITHGLTLIQRNKNIWPDRVFAFFKKNKNAIPQEAGEYFSKTINENLKSTGDYYYHIIADALKQLKQINKDSAREWTLHLCLNYKRRSKLMSMINGI